MVYLEEQDQEQRCLRLGRLVGLLLLLAMSHRRQWSLLLLALRVNVRTPVETEADARE
jgi:hypothetical protein